MRNSESLFLLYLYLEVINKLCMIDESRGQTPIVKGTNTYLHKIMASSNNSNAQMEDILYSLW